MPYKMCAVHVHHSNGANRCRCTGNSNKQIRNRTNWTAFRWSKTIDCNGKTKESAWKPIYYLVLLKAFISIRMMNSLRLSQFTSNQNKEKTTQKHRLGIFRARDEKKLLFYWIAPHILWPRNKQTPHGRFHPTAFDVRLTWGKSTQIAWHVIDADFLCWRKQRRKSG